MQSTTARGYGTSHQREKQWWVDWLAESPDRTAQCACDRGDCPHHAEDQCPVVIDGSAPFDLGHNEDRTGYVGPECVSCNRSAGARNSNRAGQMTIRQWGGSNGEGTA